MRTNLPSVIVKINDQEVTFLTLQLQEALCSINDFSFIVQEIGSTPNIKTYTEFYKKNLGAKVSINFNGEHEFDGVIDRIDCINQYEQSIAFKVEGKGTYLELDAAEHCKSYSQSSLETIYKHLIKHTDLKANINPTHSDKLYYTVQYNQTNFAFMCMLAARYGEWLYYDGKQLQLQKPSGNAIKIHLNNGTLFDWSLQASVALINKSVSAFDAYTGNALNNKDEVDSPKGTGLLATSMDSGKQALGKGSYQRYSADIATNQGLKQHHELLQQASLANAVRLKSKSYLSNISVGALIDLMNAEGVSEGLFIVIEVQHYSSNSTAYYNEFVAIPSETTVPPYTDPNAFPYCKPQPAIVTDNEDKDGLSRVKVRFPWQDKNDKTNWISVTVPHAGKGKGFRFLPEIEDEVIVDFINHNPDRPFIVGAVYSEKNKAEVQEAGNHIKSIGTLTNRRIDFDDKNGIVKMIDAFPDKKGNSFQFINDNKQCSIAAKSGLDGDKFSVLLMEMDNKISLIVNNGSEHVVSIELNGTDKNIAITSKGNINIEAQENVNIKGKKVQIVSGASEIKMDSQNISLSAFTTKIDCKNEFKASAQTSASISSLNTKIAANANLEMSGGGISVLKGGLVKIN
jgi:type VI secretion system secreted protein VgrG